VAISSRLRTSDHRHDETKRGTNVKALGTPHPSWCTRSESLLQERRLSRPRLPRFLGAAAVTAATTATTTTTTTTAATATTTITTTTTTGTTTTTTVQASPHHQRRQCLLLFHQVLPLAADTTGGLEL
jgi:hypothetical protein